MTDVRTHPHQLQVHPQRQHEGGVKVLYPQSGPSSTQVLAVIAGVPVGGTLLTLSGLTLAGSVIALLLAFPFFFSFSPVIVPAAFVIGLAMTGFLASGAIGLVGLSSMSWVLNNIRLSMWDRGLKMLDKPQKTKLMMSEETETPRGQCQLHKLNLCLIE